MQILEELRDLLPPLESEELEGLEESISKQGQLAPIQLGMFRGKKGEEVCESEPFIIDGHNRYNICRKLGLDPTYSENVLDFVHILEAKIWVAENQLGKRNLTPFKACMVARTKEGAVKELNLKRKSEGGKVTKEDAQISAHLDDQRDYGKNTRNVIANEAGVSHDTYHKACVVMDRAKPDIIAACRRGEISINAAYKPFTNTFALGTGYCEWYTPSNIVEAARNVLGFIDLDPASSDKANEVVKAERYYTKADDGLKKDWAGRVWMNPPYSHPEIGYFVGKLVEGFDDGSICSAITLTDATTDTKWAHDLFERLSAICFVQRRVKFIQGDTGEPGSPLKGQMFCYLGDNIHGFQKEFSEFGQIFFK